MLTIFLVAGKNTEGLRKFLDEKGSAEIPYAYTTLHSAAAHIENNIVEADLLLYVYKASDMDARREFQFLKSLLMTNKFCNFRRIVLVLEKPKEGERVLDYFNSVMEDASYTNFEIDLKEDAVSFHDCWATLTGITTSSAIKNHKIKVFRTERGTEDHSVHDYGGNNTILEPFDIESMKLAKLSRDALIRTETGVPLTESPIAKTIPRDLEFMHLDTSLDLPKPIFVFNGVGNVGCTTYMLYIISSFVAHDKRVLIIDLSDNNHLAELAENNKIYISKFNSSVLVARESVPLDNQIGLIDVTKFPVGLRENIVTLGISVPARVRNYDYIFIDCPDLETLEIFRGLNYNLIHVTGTTNKAVEKTLRLLQKYEPRFIMTSVMDNCNWEFETVPLTELNMLYSPVRVLKPLPIEDFHPMMPLYGQFLNLCGENNIE